MTERPEFPPLGALTLNPEQVAILHLFDRLRVLEEAFQREVLKNERAQRGLRSHIEMLKAKVNSLQREVRS
ncbi:hypothetical protein [Paragemmobacter straminiformis]|uniref:Uncharacterized protein n=1 Tax=Paragemmobacter straminiformis TaxID=2045119 RepID=A0A842I5I7_9RHOB|nr:hypothetical protein [Gemmobacter straminiformis]MBC2834683.1 hypothetical protein [Gemmobacter straminiformis]